MTLLDALRHATPADLAALDAEIAALTALRGLLATRLAPAAPPAPPPPEPAPPPPAPAANGHAGAPHPEGEPLKLSRRTRRQVPPEGTSGGRTPRVQMAERRLAAARYLAEHGPSGPTELAAALGMGGAPKVYRVVDDCPWFAREGGKIHLTNEGRAEALPRKSG